MPSDLSADAPAIDDARGAAPPGNPVTSLADPRLTALGKPLSFRAGFEWVQACDLCGHDGFTPRKIYPEYLLFTGERFQLVACQRCQLHFLSPRPDAATIGEYYPADYGAHQNVPRPLRPWQRAAGGQGAPPPGPLGRLHLYLRQQVSWYFIPPFERGGRVLDIGCGSGKLLDTLKHLGWETHGVEVAPSAVERACAKGHQVTVGTAETEAHDDGAFDVVYMWHVLEHTHHPSRALANAHRYLKPDGRFYLCVPNYRSLHASLFGRYWWSTDAPRHLYQFDRRTIRAYLERAGFRDIQITTRTGASSWWRGLRHTCNGWFGTRFQQDPSWALDAMESLVVTSALVRFLGAGSELRISCRK